MFLNLPKVNYEVYFWQESEKGVSLWCFAGYVDASEYKQACLLMRSRWQNYTDKAAARRAYSNKQLVVEAA